MAEEQPKQRRSGSDRNQRFGDKKNDSKRDWRGRGHHRTDSEESSARSDRRERWDRKPRQHRAERGEQEERGTGRGEFRGQRGERRGQRSKDQFGRNRRDQEARIRQRGDQRSANREDRGRSPDIDPDVTGKELNKVVLKQISGMDDRNRSWVSKHLVMAGRLLATDPELAFEHALAASRRGGRHAVVREAVGLTAYAAGHYHDALREFRTYRRISGDQSHLPLMAASEAALGRPEKAIELAESIEAEKLEVEQKVDMAIIISGVYADMKEYEKAKTVLELPQLNLGRAYSFSPRLFRAYGEALTDLGQLDEAQTWFNQATVADAALGTGDFAPPEIIDLGEDLEEEEPKPRVKDVLDPATTEQQGNQDTAAEQAPATDGE
ncbi:hypothetical protein [Micrococcoides hystricis]|uniref:Tetratricopeptide repeat protein n=1 Tax=Micrococcoides hystricis TaxID=1572761 RepID=A0ABV6P6L4_9MICC